MSYKVKDLIEYGDGSPGIVIKTYWDGSVMIVDPYTLGENEEYHIVEHEDIIGRIYTIPPITKFIIDTLERIMPIEYYPLLSLAVGIIIGIGAKLL